MNAFFHWIGFRIVLFAKSGVLSHDALKRVITTRTFREKVGVFDAEEYKIIDMTV